MGKNSSVELVIKARDDASRALKAITDAGDAFNAMQSHMSENSAKVKAALNNIGEAVLRTQKNMSELGKSTANITKLQAALAGLATQESSANRLSSNIQSLNTHLADLTLKQDQLTASQKKVTASTEATELRLAAYKAKAAELQKSLSDLRASDNKLVNGWNSTDAAITKLTGKLDGWRVKLTELQAAQAASGKNTGQSGIDKLAATISRNEAELSILVAKLAQLDSELVISGNAVRQAEAVNNAWKNVIAETTTKLDVQRQAVKAFNDPIKQLGADMKTVAAELKSATSDFDRMTNGITRQKDTIVKLESSLTGAGVDVTNLAGEMSRLTANSQKAEVELARLAARAESMKKLAQTNVSAVSNFNLPTYSSGSDPRVGAATANYEKLKAAVQEVLALQDKIDSGLGTAKTKSQLAELVVSLRGTATEFKAFDSTIESLKSELTNLTQLREFATQIDKQVTSVNEAKAAYESLKAELNTARAAYRTAGSDVTKFAVEYERSLAAAAQGRAIYQAQAQTLNNMRQAFASAGLSASNMAGSQASLDAAIRRTGATIQTLSHGMNLVERAERTTATSTRALGSAMGAADKGTLSLAGALEKLSSNGRTTLSFMQRLRGQVLAVTAAYVGLYGAFNQIQQVYKTEVTMASAETKLTFVNDGDRKKAKEDLQFVKDVSNGLGTSLQDSIKNYSNFAAATKDTNLAGDRTKLMFYNLSKAGRALRISNDDMHGSFIALQQMINKQKVSAEELNQQLGERFPGASAKFAKSLGMDTKELFKLMSQGKVSSDAVYLFTKMIGEETTAAAAEGADAVDAWVNRAHNAFTELQQTVAEGGFTKELALAMQELTEAAKTPEAKAGFQALGQLIGNVIRLLAQLITHASEVGNALKTIGEIWLAWKSIGVLVFIYTLNAQFVTMLARVGALVVESGLLGAALTGLGAAGSAAMAALAPIIGTLLVLLAAAAAAAYAIFNSEWLYNQSETVRNFVDWLANKWTDMRANHANNMSEMRRQWDTMLNALTSAFETWMAGAIGRWNELGIAIKLILAGIEKAAAAFVSGPLASLWDNVANGLDAIGMEDAAKSYRAGAKDIQAEMHKTADAAMAEVDAKLEANDKWVKSEQDRVAKAKELKQKEIEDRAKSEKDANEAERKMRKDAQAMYRSSVEKQIASRSTNGTEQFNALEGQAKNLKPGNESDLNPIDKGNGNGSKAAENLANRLNDSMEKVRAKIAELAAQTEDESMNAIREKVAAQYEKLIRDLEKAGRTADANQVRSLIEIETKAKQAELRQKNSEKAEKSMNDLLAQRKEILTALATARSKGDSASQQYASQLVVMLKDNEAQLRQSVANAGALAKKYGDVKLANEAALNTEKLRTLTLDEQMAQLQTELDKQKERKDELLKQLEIVKEFGQVEGLPNTDQLTEGLKNANGEMAKLYDQMIKLAEASGDFKLADKLRAAKAEATNLNNALITADQVNQTFASSATTALMDIGEGFGKILSGTMSLKEGFKAAGTVFRQFAADFLKQIAQMIIQAAILKAIQASGFGGWMSGLTTLHGGGSVGSGSALRKSVNPMVFAAATRYHTGGVAGLAPDEVPAVLQQGEEVLTQKDPRHRNNLFGQGQTQKPQDIKIVNTIDSGDFVSQGMSTRAGQQAVANYIRANKTTINQILGNK